MTMPFDPPHWLRWLLRPGRARANRSVAVVLGIIGISLLIGVLRVIDAALSGALVDPAAMPASADAPSDRHQRVAGPMDASWVEMPDAIADAIRL